MSLALNITLETYPASSYGWLLAVGDQSWESYTTGGYGNCSLLNPVTKHRISLPSLNGLSFVRLISRGWCIRDAVITSHPILNQDDCVVMAIFCRQRYGYKSRLIFCKPGHDDSWCVVQHEIRHYTNIIFCNGLFYALDRLKRAVDIFDIGLTPDMEQIILPESCNQGYMMSNYIIESYGEVLLVHIARDHRDYAKDYKLQIFKLEQSRKKWSQMKSLGDRTIFSSDINSITVSASNHPMLKRNC
ncbi:hypothetical protein GIB67_013462, partial [Kingdonia uniflora]